MRQDLERVYRTHRQGLFTLALAITRDADAAEDAVQSAFERMVRSPGAPPADLAAYAFAAVRNAARVHSARRRGPCAIIPERRQNVPAPRRALKRGRAGRYTWTLCSPGRGPGEPVP